MAAGPCCGPIPNLSTTQLHDLSGRLAEPSAYGHRDSVPNSPSATGTVGLPAHRLKGNTHNLELHLCYSRAHATSGAVAG